jgi:hypothetical protein
MKLLHSGLYIHNFDPVNRYDRGRQYELQVDVGQLADDSGSVQIKIIVISFQRFSDGLNSHAVGNSAPTFPWFELGRTELHLKQTPHRLCLP